MKWGKEKPQGRNKGKNDPNQKTFRMRAIHHLPPPDFGGIVKI
jgi:hypothetical protein